MSEFVTGTLNDLLLSVVGGGTPARGKVDYWEGEIPWASVKDISSSPRYLIDTEEHISADGLRLSAANLIPPGIPVMATRMAVGAVTLTTAKTAINQDLKALFPNESTAPEFLRYLLLGISKYLNRQSIGSTVKGITLKALLSSPVQFPKNIAEQRGIAEVLSALDEQIEQTEALVGKIVSRRVGLVQEFLSPLAHTCPTEALGDACSLITSGSRGWAQYYADEGALFLRIGNLTRAHPNFRFEDVIRVRVPEGGEGARTRLAAGDVLISITADLGVIGCVPDGMEEAYVNQHIALARISDAELNPRWVAHYLGSPLGYNQIAKLNDGGAKAGLNLPTIRALRIPKPSPETQATLVQLLDSVDDEIALYRAEAAKLRLLKQGLMRDLLTGKVRVTGGANA